MRILITGSRDWDDRITIRGALYDAISEAEDVWHNVLVSGACPTGADFFCEKLFLEMPMSVEVERHPADWETLGKRAGFVRNAEMVNLGADICLAFIKNNSKGATMTKDMAIKAGIPTKVYRA